MLNIPKTKQQYIIGCDEVGRGSLAGPVVAAAVVFDLNKLNQNELEWMSEVKDSKLVSSKNREKLDKLIRSIGLSFVVAGVSPEIIDRINIHQATQRAMHAAVKKSRGSVSHATDEDFFVQVDGKFAIPNLKLNQKAIVNGDATEFAIAAASIIAKVYRDALMVKLHEKFPKYNFAKHKGYGTQEHRSAIMKYGITEIHRKTFCSNFV